MAETGIKISEKTIRRRLSMSFNLKSYRSAQKPRLTEAIKKKCLESAKKHHHWDTEMWKNVLFSNESSKNNSLLGNIEFGDRLEHDIRKNYHPNSEAPFQ